MTAQAHAVHPYAGLSAFVCTMHAKERAIAPAFSRHLQINVAPTTDVDTDQFGTFTGEIARTGTAMDAAIRKARYAVEVAKTRLGLGSEGSFGPHPLIPFIAVDRELLAFYDRDQDITIVESLHTHRTNYAHVDLDDLTQLEKFINAIGFPSHAIVMSVYSKGGDHLIEKGVQDHRYAIELVTHHLSQNDGRLLRASTDMRAHFNPTRMRVIRALSSRLARRIARLCPACRIPGFGERSYERGMPCSWCGEPTRLIRAIRITCQRCRYDELTPARAADTRADPRHCDFCNP